MWDIGLRADDARAKGPHQWRGKILLGEALSAVREEIRDIKTGLANPASAGRFRTPTGNAGTRNFVRATVVLAVRGQRLPRSFLGVSDLFFGAPADQSQEVLEIASGVGLGLAFSEHGPCFVGGTVTLDDVSFTTSFAIHLGRGCHRGTWRSSILFSPKPCLLYTSPSPRD